MPFPLYQSKTEINQIGKDENDLKPKCHAIIFKNAGDMRVKINDVWILEPGEETPTISTGNPEVIDLSSYKITFDPTGGGTVKLVTYIAIFIRPFNMKGSGGSGSECENF